MEKFDNISIPWSGWRIIRKLGSGGFGSVYEIERDLFGKKEKAALKIIEIPQIFPLSEENSSGISGDGGDAGAYKYCQFL